MDALSNYDNKKTMHATLYLPQHSPTQEISIKEALEAAGLQYVGFPFTKSNVTGICTVDGMVEICVSWEEEEDIGECESG